MIHFLGISLQVFLVDILLSGDNAVVIALACRTLPEKQRRTAMIYGAGAGILLRLFLSFTVNGLLRLPLLKIIGAVALLLIAIGLMAEEEEIAEATEDSATPTLSAAVATIVAADLVMSLDNVVALAAVSQGSFIFLGLGLILSVPLLIFGSGVLSRLMDDMPELITLGGALLGWVAGSIAVTDPLIAGWVGAQSPALAVVVPLASAILAVAQGRRLVAEQRQREPRSRQSLQLPTLWDTGGADAEDAAGDAPTATAQTVAASVASPSIAQSVTLPSAPQASQSDELPVEDGQDSPVEPTPAAVEPDEEIDSGTATAQWEKRVMIGLSAVVTLLVLVMSLVTERGEVTHAANDTPNFSVAPRPDPLEPFQCGVYNSIFFYHHGSMQIRLQADNVTLTGILIRNTIFWNPQPAGAPPLGFTPPTTVLDDSANSVTVKGGSFPETVCTLPNSGSTGQ